MKPFRIQSCLCLAMAAGFLLAGCDRTSKYQGVDMSSNNTVPLSGVCVGQFELQVPKTGQKDWDVDLDWAKVSRLPFRLHTDRDFWDFVEQRRDYLASQKHEEFPSLLERYEKVGSNAAMILHWQEPYNTDALFLERYLWLGDRGYFFKGLGEGEEIRGKLEGYKRVFSKLTPLTQDHAGLRGFCIDGAVVSLDLPEISASLSIQPRDLANTRFYISSVESANLDIIRKSPEENPEYFGAIGELKEAQERFAREKSISDLSKDPTTSKDFQVLRKGHRIVAERQGEEAVWQRTLNNGVNLYEFRWFVSDDRPSLHDNPSLSLQLSSGDEMKPEDKGVPEEKLFALWDAVLDSAKGR